MIRLIPGYRVSIHTDFVFPIAPADITVISIIPDHLLPLVQDMGKHGCQPPQGIKDTLFFAVFGPLMEDFFLPVRLSQPEELSIMKIYFNIPAFQNDPCRVKKKGPLFLSSIGPKPFLNG